VAGEVLAGRARIDDRVPGQVVGQPGQRDGLRLLHVLGTRHEDLVAVVGVGDQRQAAGADEVHGDGEQRRKRDEQAGVKRDATDPPFGRLLAQGYDKTRHHRSPRHTFTTFPRSCNG
jgi:hypothetical protein